MPLTDLIPTLQLAIGPMILISGVGMILLSMTNRFGRIIDRSRLLADELDAAPLTSQGKIVEQLRILARRARLVRTAIALVVFSVLLAALLIITLFVGALLNLAIGGAIATLFILCMLSVVAALLFLFADINVSLKALWLELPPEALGED